MAEPRPLDGLKVLELGQLLAGPFAGTLLGYFGADVIKIEPPSGDPIRSWRGMDGDTSVWWRSLARNKRCIVVDLRTAAGRDLVRDLARTSDVLIENFRPGTMEGWGLGPEVLRSAAPRLIYARVSGFGQTGPYRERAGFASVCEAVAGLRFLTGKPGEVPLRSNLSLGDSLGGLHAVLGLLLALYHRERTGQGQVVDVALTESVLSVLEAVLPEYDRLGIVREPSGATITGVAPSNVYACEGGSLVVIGANTDRLFAALMRAVGRDDLADDPALATNPGRVARGAQIDQAIAAWTSQHAVADVVLALAARGVPAGPVNDARAVLSDPQLIARGVMEPVGEGAASVRLPAMYPKLSATPGRSEWEGPALGAHTDEVLRERLGLDADACQRLRQSGVTS